jgi:activator of 2-hydroxyglutaryl-CoA dehydratase
MASTPSSSSPTPNKLVRQRSAGKKSGSTKYILGIDIGTTSVKISLVDQKTGEAGDKFVKDTLAGAASDCGPAGDLQVRKNSVKTLSCRC